MKATQQKLSLEEKKKQFKQKAQLKKEIEKDLKFNLLKDKIIYYSQQLLIFNQIDSQNFNKALSILNVAQFDDIIEERVSLLFCCNLKCHKVVDKDSADKVLKRKYQISVAGGLQKIDQHKIFCDKVKRKEESECEKQYLIINDQIQNSNDGGGFFNSAFIEVSKILLDYSNKQQENGIFQLDKDKIRNSVEKFQQEISLFVQPIKEKTPQIQQSLEKENVEINNKLKEEVKAQAQFKVNIVSSRRPTISETKEKQESQNQQIELLAESQEIKSKIQDKQKKSVRFSNQEEEQDDNEQILEDQNESQEPSNNNSENASSMGDNFLELDDIHEELENFRQNEMTPFQKVHDLFLTLTNDNLYYYLNGKKTYEESDSFLKSSTRDFFFRQINIQIDESIFPVSKIQIKHYIKDLIDLELQKLTFLMDIHSLSQSYENKEWTIIAKLCLKMVEKRLNNTKEKDEYIADAVKYIQNEVQIDDMDQIILDMLN